MNSETRNCQNCKNEFEIRPDDLTFYDKMKVPPPTFCPLCRMERRMAWRNERSLYKRKSDLSGKDIIAIYSEDKPFKVYDQKEWWGDTWDGVNWGKEYDFSKPFFVQFRELREKIPRLSIANERCVNSDYTNQSYDNKNVYLSFSVADSEDSAYCGNINGIRNSLDLLYANKSELLYESVDSEESTNCQYIINSRNCMDSAFLYDSRGCNDCIGGVGLRNKKYVFWGNELTKEEFEKRKEEHDLGGKKEQEAAKARFVEMIKTYPRRAARLQNCVNSKGDLLRDCKQAHECFGSFGLENCAYNARIYSCKDVYDSYGLGEAELIYETIGNQNTYGVKFANVTSDSRSVTYCDLCFNCEDCFGCVGLKKKQYCILNKRYSKEEYEALLPKIIEQMNSMPYRDKSGREYRYGEFFPVELSPFAYNETIAKEYFTLTKEEAEAEGYLWKKPETKNYAITKKPEDLPNHIRETKDEILKEIIGCSHNGTCEDQCTTAFKITDQELKLYRKMNIPLPRLCPNCRHYARLAQRTPLKLWQRKCQCAGAGSEGGAYKNTGTHSHGPDHCPNEFKTSYASERPEIVYCEACYNSEIA